MKIKLVTFAPHPNFGTCLQSFALNKILKDMGHEVEFIYNGRENPPKTLLFYMKAIIKFVIPSNIVAKIQQNNKIKQEKKINKVPYILQLPNNYLLYILSKFPCYKSILKKVKYRTLQWSKVYSFTFEDGNYNMKRLYIKKQYDEVVDDADLFITGSDQIWNPYCGGFNPMMFLEFAKNKKRIAYSSSIARPCFPKEIEQRVKSDLMKFQHIAVRERSSVLLLNNLLERDDIQLVVDPTYLIPAEEWVKFGNRANIEFEVPEKFIFCYFVGERFEDYIDMVEDVKNRTGIENVITLDCYNRTINYGNGILYKDGGPYEWVNLLSRSSMVCMDSFHATVFALKFHKDFVHILKNKDDINFDSQNTRMYDILKRYNLIGKLYDPNSTEWLQKINFDEVDKLMEMEIRQSMSYLEHAIKD